MQFLASLSPISKYVNNGCCTLRRMLIIGAAFIGFSILMLLFQYYLTRGGSTTFASFTTMKRSTVVASVTGSDPNISLGHCWLHEEHVVVGECIPCSHFEKAAGIKPCRPSGHYDIINCTSAGVVFRSCQRVQWLEERNFIAFMVASSLCAITFTFLAHWRQKTLDRLTMQKLQKQLGDGM